MKGTHKPFNKSSHARYDAVAKDIIVYNINQRAILGEQVVACENPDRYGPDLLLSCEVYNSCGETEDTEFTGYGECEVKTNWQNTDKFPFGTLNILERKKKYFDMGTTLFMLNICMNRCLVVTPEDLKYKRPVEVRNRFCPEGELFYKIPIIGLTMHRLETLF